MYCVVPNKDDQSEECAVLQFGGIYLLNFQKFSVELTLGRTKKKFEDGELNDVI